MRIRYRYGYLSVIVVVRRLRRARSTQAGSPAGRSTAPLADRAMRGQLTEDGWIAATVDDHPIPAR